MFAHCCTDCQRRLLVFPSQIRGLARTAEGFEVTYECWCGSTQTWSSTAVGSAPAAA
ncbi:MAG TPA: hypothetical protein PLP61_08865 [Nocardioides sp.]|uniref:hypothetical protein n=1 Tax=Nocardioides sp. TaxID=35761 RepID=UPI002BBB6E64|nr:hypothetical protein [Nocardioides sp.]HQR27134.1 hypothetical protein [Nocardioides sp.]